MKKHFYIGDNIATANSNDLKGGVRIICFITESISIKSEELEGPYDSIIQLRKESSIFKELAKTNPSRVRKILEEKNIFKVKKIIVSENNKSSTIDFIKTIQHSIKGDVRSKTIFGVHFFDSDKMKIKKIIEDSDNNGIWKALVEVYDMEQKKWFEKESTFFPINWSLTQLFQECDYAYQNKQKCDQKRFIYYAKTLSGIPVELVIKDNELKSIYPIMTKIGD